MCSGEKLKGCVVGCRAGRGHALAMAESDEFAVAAVCDLDEGLAAKVAEEVGGAALYTDYGQMLEREKPDVVAVATPNDSHARLTVAAAEAGVGGVCCEKPMATSMAEGRAMLDACGEHGVRLIVAHQRRMGRPLLGMRRLIEDGAIGEPYLIRGSCAGDVLSDGTHLVDSIRWLAGDAEAAWVLGQVFRLPPPPDQEQAAGYHTCGGYRYGHPVESGGMALIEFAGGLRAELFTGQAQFPGRYYQDYEVFGSEGRLWRQGDRAEPPVLIQDAQGGGWRAAPVQGDAAPNEPRVAMYRQFARTICEGAGHPLSGESGLADLELVMGVYESARTSRRIALPLEQEEFPLRLMIEEGRL